MIIDDVHSERAAVAAFLRLKGSTRCPTAYGARTCASTKVADRVAPRQHAAAQNAAYLSQYSALLVLVLPHIVS